MGIAIDEDCGNKVPRDNDYYEEIEYIEPCMICKNRDSLERPYYMQNFIKYAGIALFIFGLCGGFSIMTKITGIESMGILTKDQFCIVIGYTWFALSK